MTIKTLVMLFLRHVGVARKCQLLQISMNILQELMCALHRFLNSSGEKYKRVASRDQTAGCGLTGRSSSLI